MFFFKRFVLFLGVPVLFYFLFFFVLFFYFLFFFVLFFTFEYDLY